MTYQYHHLMLPDDSSHEVRNVLHYGANTVPGVTDMTAAVQAAIDALPSTGGEVFIPPEVFMVTGIKLDGTLGDKTNVTLRGVGSASHLKKLAHASITTDADRKANVIQALNGHGHKVLDLKVEGNLSRGGLNPAFVTKHTLGDVLGSAGRLISVSAAGGSSTGAADDLVYEITVTGSGQTSSASNISVDVSAGYVALRSDAYSESSGTGVMNAYQLDNDFAYRAGIYMNGRLAAMDRIEISGCEVTDCVYAGILHGAGPLFASETYFGTVKSRVHSNTVYANGASNIGGGKKVRAAITGNTVGMTDSSGIRCDEGSHNCTVTANIIDCEDEANSNGGVSVYKSHRVSVQANFITRTAVGVAITESDRAAIGGNNITDVGTGISLNKCDYGNVLGNNIEDTSGDGIKLTTGSYNKVIGNPMLTIGGQEINDTSTASHIAFNGTDTDNELFLSRFAHIDRAINGSFRFAQRGASALAVSDDTYGPDRWNILTQSNPIQFDRLDNPFDGARYGCRLTQSNASAQRFGMSQIVEGRDCIGLRGKNVTWGGRFRCSAASQTLRFVILQWTGTEDAVTSDVVNSWTSGSFTAGSFFINTTYTIGSIEAHTTAANAWTEFSVTEELGSTFSNIVLFSWISGTQAQNTTLDFANTYLVPGMNTAIVHPRAYADELALCERFYQSFSAYVPATTAQNLRTIRMRAVPTIAGGGGGFTSTGTTADALIAFQTAGAVQALTLSAEL